MNSGKGYKFKCDCGHIFWAVINDITGKSSWCQYCSHTILCNDEKCEMCFDNSFASHSKSKHLISNIPARQLFKYSNKLYSFKCNTCFHVFNGMLNNITSKGTWCTYCSNLKMCYSDECITCFNKSVASHEISKFWSKDNIDSDRNYINPRTVFKGCDIKYIFNCNDCKKNFNICPCNAISRNQWCTCKKKKTEAKFRKWFESVFEIKLKSGYLDWCKNKKTGRHLPFDFYEPSRNLIIEVDGDQHVRQVSNWASYEEIQTKDFYKMNCALKRNISIIRINQPDIWNDTFDWKKEFVDVVNKMLSGTPVVYYLTKDPLFYLEYCINFVLEYILERKINKIIREYC